MQIATNSIVGAASVHDFLAGRRHYVLTTTRADGRPGCPRSAAPMPRNGGC